MGGIYKKNDVARLIESYTRTAFNRHLSPGEQADAVVGMLRVAQDRGKIRTSHLLLFGKAFLRISKEGHAAPGMAAEEALKETKGMYLGEKRSKARKAWKNLRLCYDYVGCAMGLYATYRAGAAYHSQFSENILENNTFVTTAAVVLSMSLVALCMHDIAKIVQRGHEKKALGEAVK